MALVGSDEILTPVTATPGFGSVTDSAAKGVFAPCAACASKGPEYMNSTSNMSNMSDMTKGVFAPCAACASKGLEYMNSTSNMSNMSSMSLVIFQGSG